MGESAEVLPRDLDYLAVHRDDPVARVDLDNGERGDLSPAQPAVGGGVHHELVAAAVPPGRQCLPQPADVRVAGISAGSPPFTWP